MERLVLNKSTLCVLAFALMVAVPLRASSSGSTASRSGAGLCSDLTDSAASCSTDATNATNITTGTLNADRLPTLTDTLIPNNITIDLATQCTTALAGDSATDFFSSGTVNTARLGSGTANSTTYLRGDQTWASIPAGATPAGSGSEINARLDGSTFQAVTGSSTASGGIALVNQNAAAVPLAVTGATSQSGDLLQVTSNGGAAGDRLKVSSVGDLTAGAGIATGTTTAAVGIGGLTSSNAGIFARNSFPDQLIVGKADRSDTTTLIVGNVYAGSTTSATAAVAAAAGYGVAVGSNLSVGFTSGTNAGVLSTDTAISRVLAGVLAVGTGSVGNRLGWDIAGNRCVVATDQTNATTTPQAWSCYVTGTTHIALTASRRYRFHCQGFLSDSVAADGAVIDFDGGTATATTFRAQATAFDTALNLSTQTTTLAADVSAATFTGNGAFEIHGYFKVNAAGSFQPRFFQAAHTTGTLTLAEGSNCVFEDVTP